MDCNKEEATRAKQLAEKKMEIKDFAGALKIAVKAQQLYPELENISQLILVCEVHCSAERKLYGTDKDWYGILKIEPSADEISIKKQYRKFALVLHPDKNKFSGSTDAFKLIGEAQRVLLDSERRLIHDSKRRAFGNISAPSRNPKQPSRQSNVQYQHPWNQGHPGNFNGGRSDNFSYTHQQAPTGVGGQMSTFWTICPFCSVRYKLYTDVLNKSVLCQNCKKPFISYELNPHGAPAAPAMNKTQTRSPKPAKGANRNFTTKPVFEKKEPQKTQGSVNKKRKRRVEESSESSDSEEDVVIRAGPKNVDKNGEQPRRSSRSKRNVSYQENVANDIGVDHADGDDDGPSNPAENGVEKHSSRKETVHQVFEKKKAESDDDTDDEMEPEVFECPDPEFSDFDKHRKEESFSVGQLWACYDTEDAMPRFYALIKKISPGFNLQIQWLKPDPVTVDERKWVKADLPVSCGRFKHEKNDKSQDLFSFSHSVTWEAGQKAKTVSIVPRKGETWALFKNWSMNWCNEDDDERKYDYEFVDILSDYNEKTGVRVSYLEKVKGFVCVFRRKHGGEMVIAGCEKYRFAHMVPSCRMSGEERDGVPEGSFELDPASLPPSAFEKVIL